jgi:hypothetical protein
MTLDVINAMACTLNMIVILIDNSEIVNEAPRIVVYAPRGMP